MEKNKTMRIGIISDTHGLLRSEVTEALAGCEAILHAGDINKQSILDKLNDIAPVYVVRGNNDKEWAEYISWFLEIEFAGKRIYITHRRADMPKDTSRYDLVVYGHSHKYDLHKDGNTIFLNPGSCGPRRNGQEITLAIAEIEEDGIQVRKVEIGS